MSIRLKILLSIIGVALAGLAMSGVQMWLGASQRAEIVTIAGHALRAGELAREARDNFDKLDDLVVEVTAMTHIVDPAKVQRRFSTGVVSIVQRLAELKPEAQSPEMERLDALASERFQSWRHDAAVTLGLERADAVPVADELARKREAVKAQLNQTVDLAGEDARRRMAGIDERMRNLTHMTLVFALAFGAVSIVAAWRIAGNLSRPIRALVAGADRLANGDTSVSFEATARRDEIGDIARAVAAFRDNVTAAKAADNAAARERQAAETQRRQSETERVASAGEQARVVDALSEGLERLAHGDLTYRIEAEFGPEYARLKTNFNKSLDALQQALGVISEGARDLQSGSAEIAGLASDLRSRTGSQTASIEEAAASLEQITATVQKTAGNARQARGVVARTREETEKSGAVVRTAVAAIARIEQSSQEIEKIIGVIDEIAFQTSLLALNAGVEAARAGETGRGFAVVATEVRALAQRSANASKEIKGLISTSSAQVKQGVDLVVSAGAALDRIFAQVSEIDDTVDAIAGAASEQATGVQSVNDGVSAIDRMNQANVNMVENTTAACASVAERAEQLVEAVAKFQIGGEATQLRRAA